MITNFGVLKDFKSTDKYKWLRKALETQKVKFGSGLQKLKSYNTYKSDIICVTNKKVKAIWTRFTVGTKDCFVLLDIIKDNYENCKYFRQKLLLEQFLQTQDPIFLNIKDTDFEDSVYELGEEVDEPFYFFHRKVVKLSHNQETILHKELSPGFYILSGIAGSGKTSIAYIKLKELYKQQKSCLFTTGNSNLADYLKKIFLEEEQGKGNIEFFGYTDLVNHYYHGVSNLEKVGFNEFEKYIQGKKLGKIQLNHKMLYSLMQYIASKPDIVPGKREFFKEIAEKDFKLCVDLYNNYNCYLSKEQKIDLSLSPLEVVEDKRFDYIIVDESQDLSPREIQNISLLKQSNTGIIIFNIDSNQHSNISLPVKYLKSHPSTKEFINVLDYSFRLPEYISKYAQRILEVRSFVMKGVPDKDMVREFSSSNSKKGNIAHIDLDGGEQLLDAANIAVIAFNEQDKLKIEQLLSHITQVFTSDEIKGMEYDSIILYDPYIYFAEILLKNHDISWDKVAIRSNLPKDINDVDHDVKILFNRFFTSVTRVKNNLYVLERYPESISKYCYRFKEYLMKDIENGDIQQVDKGTDKDWLHQINLLAINNNVSQAIKAYKKKEFSLDKVEGNGVILTYELCLIGVLTNIDDMVNVPNVYRNHKLYKDVLKYYTFKNIPATFKDTEFCKVAIDVDVNNILHVPSQCSEIDNYFLEKFDNLLVEIPQGLKTVELCILAIEKDFKNNFNGVPNKYQSEVYRSILTEQYSGSLECFPQELINKNLTKVAVDINVNNLKYIPQNFLTDDVCKLALQRCHNFLKDLPRELVNKQMADVAISLDPYNLCYAPDKFKDYHTYTLALKFYNNSLEKFPEELLNNDIREAAVRVNPYNLQYPPYNKSLKDFPIEFITQEVAEVGVQLDVSNLNIIYRYREEFAKKNKINFDKIHKAVLRAYNNSLEKFPRKFLRQAIAALAVRLDMNNLKYLTAEDKKDYIQYAIHNNDAKTLEFWLKAIKDEGTQEATSLIDICINARDNKGNTQLISCAKKSHTKRVIEVLLKYGVQIDVQGEYGMTALHWLAEDGNLETIQLLLNKKADISITCDRKATALHYATYTGNLKLVQCLVEKGSDINMPGPGNRTALYCAVEKGDIAMVEYLIEKGSFINMPGPDNKTPLYCATENGDLDIVRYLIEKGSYINVAGPRNKTELYRATEKGYLNIVEYLVEKVGGIDVLGPMRNTLIDCATRKRHSHIVDYLKNQSVDIKNVKTPVREDKKKMKEDCNHTDLIEMDNKESIGEVDSQNINYLRGTACPSAIRCLTASRMVWPLHQHARRLPQHRRLFEMDQLTEEAEMMNF